MFVMTVILESIALVAGSALMAGFLCWTAASLADRIHHHGWAAFLVLFLLSILFLTGLTRSEFIRLSAICGLFGSLFLWMSSGRDAGAANMKRRSDR
jgi:hypothetical protein